MGEHSGVSFLVMEYLHGETLAARVARGPLPLEQVVRYGVQICDALERAHRLGVIHRAGGRTARSCFTSPAT